MSWNGERVRTVAIKRFSNFAEEFSENHHIFILGGLLWSSRRRRGPDTPSLSGKECRFWKERLLAWRYCGLGCRGPVGSCLRSWRMGADLCALHLWIQPRGDRSHASEIGPCRLRFFSQSLPCLSSLYGGEGLFCPREIRCDTVAVKILTTRPQPELIPVRSLRGLLPDAGRHDRVPVFWFRRLVRVEIGGNYVVTL